MKRRSFFVTAASAAGALLKGANEKVRVGFIGTRGRGQELIRDYARSSEARIAAICDVDETIRNAAAAAVDKVQHYGQPNVYGDLRVCWTTEIDAVVVATCNHWHALATVWACQAGKDVYVEKPASHNLVEGRRMMEAATHSLLSYSSSGHQARSLGHYQQAIQLLRQSAIGKLYMAKGLCYKRRRSIGRYPDSSPPAGVNYDLWLGPAPARSFNQNRFHYWHWFWDYGNGDIGNQGVHEMDIARWGLGKTGFPVSVHSDGGHFIHDADQETPNTQIASFRYDDCILLFEVRGLVIEAREVRRGAVMG